MRPGQVFVGDPVLDTPPLPFRCPVTICIAAKAADRGFVAISDRMLSLVMPDETLPGVDNATGKAMNFGWGWYVVAAGDLGVAKAIVVEAQRIAHRVGPQPLASCAQISRAFRRAFQRVHRERVEDLFLSPTRIRWRDVRKGCAEGNPYFLKLERRMRRYEFPVGLIVFGEDMAMRQHLLVVRDPGIVEDREYLGYWAIGTGANAAFATLASRWVNRPPQQELIYRLCDAKFAAEGAPGVGRMTNVLVVDPFTNLTEIHPKYIDQLRDIWEQERGPAGPSPRAIAVIDEALRKRFR